MPETSADKIKDLLGRQKAFFQAGGSRGLEKRLTALDGLEKALQARQEDFLQALAKDLGKPTVEAFLAEYYFLLTELRLIRKKLKQWLRPQKVGSPFYFWPCRNEVRWEPHGTVLIIAPWNYPLQLALAPLLGAIAAGNTVVLKPSEETPASSEFLASLLRECFEEDWVSVQQGGAEFTSSLLEHRFDFIFFTGSTQIGKIIAEKAAPHLTPCILELGGKCPCVVDDSADLEMAAKRIWIGKLFNAGQTCFAPDFIAVEASVKEKLIAELKKVLETYPWESEMTRIINERHFERLHGLCDESHFVKGRDDKEALHLAPRVAEVDSWEMPLMQEEIFGPILPVISFENEEELLSKLSSLPEPLALYCFSKKKDFVEALAERVPSGGVCVNDVGKHGMNLALPFGGKGPSGHGRYRGKRSVQSFSYERAYTKRFFFPDPFESLPPRGKQAEFLRKWMK